MKKPRKHNPKWKDSTVAKRQSKRREQLDLKAQEAGYLSWSAYETAVINGDTRLTPHVADKG